VNQVTGILGSVPKNTYKILVRKGVTCLAGQVPQVLLASVTLDIPAGSDSTDPSNVRAAIGLLIGSLNQISASIGDTAVTGVI
jgi:hypothetical protein